MHNWLTYIVAKIHFDFIMNFDIGIYSFIAMHKKETNMHLLLKLGFHHYSCKRLVPSRLHELHESKFPSVTRIEFIRSKLSNCSAHVSGDSAGLGWITGIYVRRLPQRSRNGGATPMRPHAVEGNGCAGLVRTGASGGPGRGGRGAPDRSDQPWRLWRIGSNK